MSTDCPDSLNWAHPLVREWFLARFGSPTEPQVAGWPPIVAGTSTLISAPTGSGKTLAAFLSCIDRLVRKALSGELRDRTEVVYVSPLKALSNDVQKNLEVPLAEIVEIARQKALSMGQIRTAVRTGDTLAPERQSMLKRPPHILVTTPESLYILLTAEKSRAMLKTVETVIVDEIHAVADDKRGAHLTLSLERLEDLTGKAPVRIGLSATQKPIEEIAGFLVGAGRSEPVIIDVGHRRKLDVAVEVPRSPLGPVASNEMWDEIYDRIAALVEQHRSTLVFVNTRRLAERVAHHLSERLGEESVAAHHGSLSRKIRLDAERRLKEGKLKALVATASLELGIDIGAVDLVCQIGSPRAIAVALQRIGRAGHWRGAVPKGRIFATTRDELIELAALVRAIRQGDLDRIIIPEAPMDILAQQIVAACATREWQENELFSLFTRAYPYRNLARESLTELVSMLTEGFAGRKVRYGQYLHRDQVNGVVRARRGSRMLAITNGGAIPETALFTMIAEPEGTMVGTLDEDFAVESNRGDIILLGTTSWRIRRIEPMAGRVLVEDAHGAPPSVPFWRGEAPARTTELSARVGELREKLSDMCAGAIPGDTRQTSPMVAEAVAWLKDECGLDDAGAEQAVDHILNGRAVLGVVPTQNTVIAERFFDESGGMQLVIHAPFGGRINKAWGLALRKKFCRSFNLELQAAATEDGINISLSEQHSFPLADVFRFLSVESLKYVLEQAALATPLFTTRWRWDGNRSLAILRFAGGKKVPPQIQRMRAEDLLAAVFPDAAACQENLSGPVRIPEHPLVDEVMKDVLTEALDLDGLMGVLRGIAGGSIRCLAVDTPVPSQFSHEILNANPYAYLDDAPLEERRARAVEMRRVLPDSVLEEVGRLEPAAIEQVREESLPDVRNADELHDLLTTVMALPAEFALRNQRAGADWHTLQAQLASAGRAGVAAASGTYFWVAAESVSAFLRLYPDAQFTLSPAAVDIPAPCEDECLQIVLAAWLSFLGPVTCSQLARLLRLPESSIERAMILLESGGSVLRGNFTGAAGADIEWCDRRLLARIHRLTLGTLRRQIEPVTAAEFMRWLTHWQHVAPGSQLTGKRGALEAIRQLQGFEIPASAWEQQILARRISRYNASLLDDLCLTGAIGWGRLSPHPAVLATGYGAAEPGAAGDGKHESIRRVVPTSVAPISFFVRGDNEWMVPRHDPAAALEGRGLSHPALEVCRHLQARGACFFADIVRGTRLLKSEVETGLWELVTAGLVTADDFDNLRSLIDPKRRAGQGRGRASRPRHSSGRWSILHGFEEMDRAAQVEAACWMLLGRYGVVFRDLLARETVVPAWRELLMTLRRLEARGEVRGGRFVGGFLGEQFALPLAVDSLRASRHQWRGEETVVISAADPLNLVGILLPGDRVPALSSKTITLRNGILEACDDTGSPPRRTSHCPPGMTRPEAMGRHHE